MSVHYYQHHSLRLRSTIALEAETNRKKKEKKKRKKKKEKKNLTVDKMQLIVNSTKGKESGG